MSLYFPLSRLYALIVTYLSSFATSSLRYLQQLSYLALILAASTPKSPPLASLDYWPRELHRRARCRRRLLCRGWSRRRAGASAAAIAAFADRAARLC